MFQNAGGFGNSLMFDTANAFWSVWHDNAGNQVQIGWDGKIHVAAAVSQPAWQPLNVLYPNAPQRTIAIWWLFASSAMVNINLGPSPFPSMALPLHGSKDEVRTPYGSEYPHNIWSLGKFDSYSCVGLFCGLLEITGVNKAGGRQEQAPRQKSRHISTAHA